LKVSDYNMEWRKKRDEMINDFANRKFKRPFPLLGSTGLLIPGSLLVKKGSFSYKEREDEFTDSTRHEVERSANPSL